MANTLDLTNALRIINTGGIVAVLILGIYLGLKGEIVTGDQLQDCRLARDAYLRDLIRSLSGDGHTVEPTIAPPRSTLEKP